MNKKELLQAYEYYNSLFKDTPEFLEKYLNLDILLRLKDISLLCAMDYASKNIYNIPIFISRYDHSLRTALFTWNLTHDKAMTLAALFHDVASPVFSHVIDFMNGDFIEQESTEEKTKEILYSCATLQEYLHIDHLDIEDIVDFKKYSVVDLPRPKMCADRLENTISVAINWVKVIDDDHINKIVNSLYLTINESGEEEIGFTDEEIAAYFAYLNDEINKLTHSNEDNYMMMLAAKIIKRCLILNLFSYDDLFKMGEREVIEIIDENAYLDYELTKMWNDFLHIKNIPIMDSIKIKEKIVNPLVNNKRLIRN